jgi:amino acid transporter
MSLADVLFGRPLASYEDQKERIGPAHGIPIFGLDALSSAAYGPEAALTMLRPLGMAGIALILPLSTAIVVLLAIVYFSYRQTIAAYPGGGGSYTVAKENLGERAGLLAAAALMIDYLLNVAVGISAGVGALVSAIPSLQPKTLPLCLLILVLLTLVNLRGVREAGVVFMAPTYLFAGSLLGLIAWGGVRALASGGNPEPVIPPPALPHAAEAVGAWLVLKAFASGCTAMTGVEAVSNGVQAFREPVVEGARKTLAAIIALLIVLLVGIAWLARIYNVGATEPGAAGYQSVLSLLAAAVAGHGVYYYVTIAAIVMVVSLSANTSFADFPRLCRAVASDGYLPQALANRGRRLVFTQGILVLAVLSAVLLILFGGVTDRLIPLFAVGAFLAFTLSQAGMVAHWKRTGGRSARASMAVNGVGALATGATLAVVLAAKFAEGAWVVVLLVPSVLGLMLWVHRHYERVAIETCDRRGFVTSNLRPPVVVVPVETWSLVAEKALRLALTLSSDIRVLHIECENEADFCGKWEADILPEIKASRLSEPRLVEIKSPYRFVIGPILQHILAIEREHPDRTIAVVIPVLVERHWYHYFLHNQRGELLSALLLLKGERRISIINVPWFLNE